MYRWWWTVRRNACRCSSPRLWSAQGARTPCPSRWPLTLSTWRASCAHSTTSCTWMGPSRCHIAITLPSWCVNACEALSWLKPRTRLLKISLPDFQAAARHHCNYLVHLHSAYFLRVGGDPLWLHGLEAAPPRLRLLDHINKVLAHQPWLTACSHIQVKLQSCWIIDVLMKTAAQLLSVLVPDAAGRAVLVAGWAGAGCGHPGPLPLPLQFCVWVWYELGQCPALQISQRDPANLLPLRRCQRQHQRASDARRSRRTQNASTGNSPTFVFADFLDGVCCLMNLSARVFGSIEQTLFLSVNSRWTPAVIFWVWRRGSRSPRRSGRGEKSICSRASLSNWQVCSP